MTHLRIEQNNSAIEQVSSAVITKLYELATSGELDLDSNLVGRLSTTATYLEYIDALHTAYPNLYISATNTYMMFEDPEVEAKLKGYIGDGVGVTTAGFLGLTTLNGSYSKQINGLWTTIDLFNSNTNLIKFNELALATNCTTLGNNAFLYCTNLEEINISNITTLGFYAFAGDTKCTFTGSGLSNIQHMNSNGYLFQGCSRITGVLNLSNYLDTSIPTHAFEDCTGITSVIIPTTVTSIGNYCFGNCSSLTSVTLPNTCTTINLNAFINCTNLTTINFPTSLTTIERSAFEGCSSLSGILDLSNTSVQNIKARAFLNTSYTGVIFPTTLTTYGETNNSSPLNTHLTTYKGLDNITTLNSSLFGNINNAIYMGLLLTTLSFPIISSQDNGNNSPDRHTSVLQMYVPKFTNSSWTSFNGYWGALTQSLFTYQGRDGINEITIKLLYFRDILYIRRLDFYCSRIKNLVINNSTPPSFNTSATIGGDTYVNYSSWENTMFGTIPTSGTGAMTIYVPDSAVATYQADSNYNSYTIRGINEVDPNTNQPYLTRYATNDLWEAAGKPEDALIEEYMN